MDLATIIGLLLAVVACFTSIAVLEGTPITPFFPWSESGAPAYALVVVGTIAATMVTAPLSGIIGLPKAILKAMMPGKHETASDLAALFVRLSEKARREGLLSLEEEESTLHNDFMKKGIMLVVDGQDPELIRQVLEIEIKQMEHRHEVAQAILTQAGGFAPTFGIIGTVSSLIGVLAKLDPSAGQEALATSISGAFVATFLGLATANLVYLPLAEKLKENTKHEVAMRNMMIEGILSVQAGENPRVIFDKLEGFLSPSERRAARARVEGAQAAA
ncbi:MAG TPA: motility protein A [Chloroflexota bacterium]|jgi:chemotaxis protein MotA|nr:motility protein A [Chloroflexota bacterium]